MRVSGGFFCECLNLDERASEMSTRQRMYLELERNFSQIGDKSHQDALSHMARAPAMKQRRHFVPYCRITELGTEPHIGPPGDVLPIQNCGGRPATPRAAIRGPIQGSSRSTRMPIP